MQKPTSIWPGETTARTRSLWHQTKPDVAPQNPANYEYCGFVKKALEYCVALHIIHYRPLATLQNECFRRLQAHSWPHSKRTPTYRRSSCTLMSKHTGTPSTPTSPQRRSPYGSDANRSVTRASQAADGNSKQRLHREAPYRTAK